MPSREIVPWVPPDQRPEAAEARARKARADMAKDAQSAAALSQARAKDMHERMVAAGRELVATQLEKLLMLAQSPDFANSTGPVSVGDLIRLAALVSNDYRLSSGQSTANIAHHVTSAIDFSAMTQEERDTWRKLALKGGAKEE